MRYIGMMQTDDVAFIKRTAAATRVLLAARGWTQDRLAKELSVDQPWVSNLVRGELREVNERVRAAHKYVNRAFETDAVPEAVIDAVRGYISAGGDVELLADWIWTLANPRPVNRSGRFRLTPSTSKNTKLSE